MISCKYENGDEVSLRHLVVDAIIIRDNKILLVKRGSYNGKPISESGKWALVGGFLDRDENLEEGIKREILEETGWEVNNLKILHINDNPQRPCEDRQNVAVIFIAKPVKQTVIKTEETKDLRWFDLNNLPAKKEMAFDHLEEIEIYKNYIKEEFNISLVG